jgi:hypothetical protein
MFSFTEYYRKRLLESNERVNNISIKEENNNNKKKRKYDEIINEKQSKTKTNFSNV